MTKNNGAFFWRPIRLDACLPSYVQAKPCDYTSTGSNHIKPNRAQLDWRDLPQVWLHILILYKCVVRGTASKETGLISRGSVFCLIDGSNL